MKYHSVWSYMASSFSLFADNQDTYIFLGQGVKFLFPLKTFTVDRDYFDRRYEQNVFRNKFKEKFPKIEKSLSLKQMKPVINRCSIILRELIRDLLKQNYLKEITSRTILVSFHLLIIFLRIYY